MKISNFFPETVNLYSIDRAIKLAEVEKLDAVIHAINSHDALVEALVKARAMLWAAKCNMHTDGSSESLYLSVKLAREDICELDEIIKAFKS